MKKLWILVAVMAVIIVMLLGLLFFYNPAKAPTIPSSGASSTVSVQSQ